jgi:hypothetical protein
MDAFLTWMKFVIIKEIQPVKTASFTVFLNSQEKGDFQISRIYNPK